LSRVVRMWQGKRRHQHTQMLASVEKGTEAQSSEKSRQVTSARIVPEIPNIVPKHHCANITPASFRTTPQSYQKAPTTSYQHRTSVSTNIVPASHQEPRKQQLNKAEHAPRCSRSHVYPFPGL